MHFKLVKMANASGSKVESDSVGGSSNRLSEESNVPLPKRRLQSDDAITQWNLVKLYQHVSEEPLAVSFAEELGLLPKERKCRLHRIPMKISYSQSLIGFFQCNRGVCRGKKRISRATGTWFEHAHISVQTIMFLMYSFTRKFPYETVMIEDFTSSTSCLSTRTIADWFNYCREVIVDYFLENQESKKRIGGPGCIVQIDESKFGRRKFNKGRRVDGHWVLGMIEDGSEDLRLEVCTDNVRSADVLIPLIKKHVKEGSVIHIDFLKEYDCLGQHGYIHKKVNHSDPDNPFVSEDGTHTQRFASQWRVVKRSFYNDSYNHNFADWVVEYQWRRNNKKHILDPFNELVKAIVHTYGDFREK